MPARSPHPPQVGIQFRDGGACGKLVSSTSPPLLLLLFRRCLPADPPARSARLPSPLHPSPSARAKCVRGRREVEAPPPSPRPTVSAAAPSRDARPRPRVSYAWVRVTDAPDGAFRETLARRRTHAGRDQLDASKMSQRGGDSRHRD